jgi:hypothetical protein
MSRSELLGRYSVVPILRLALQLRIALVSLALTSCASSQRGALPLARPVTMANAPGSIAPATTTTKPGEHDSDRPAANEDFPSVLTRGWKALLEGRTADGQRILKQAVRQIESTPLPPYDTPGRISGLGFVDHGMLVDGTNLAVLQGSHQLLLVDVDTHGVEAQYAGLREPDFLRAVHGQPLVVARDGRSLHVLEVRPRELVPRASWPNITNWTVASDGSLLLVEVEADGNDELIAWDTHTRKETSRTKVKNGDPSWLELVDRNRVVLFDPDGTVTHVVELGTGRELFVQAGPQVTLSPAFSSDGRWVAYIAPAPEPHPATTVVLVERATGKELARSSACPAPLSTVAFDPGGPLLAVGGPGSVCFLEAPSLRSVARALGVWSLSRTRRTGRGSCEESTSPSTCLANRQRVYLDILGGRFLLARCPFDDQSALIELPSRRVVFRGYASLNVARDGTKFALSRASRMLDVDAAAEKWTVDAAGGTVRQPWTGRYPGYNAPSDAHEAPWSVMLGASLRLCRVNGWIVPKEACDP